ncbi:magnesium chelatase [Paenibacillus montaniterrae]|uniref:Magnesium chelatase n=1 Tax=Paenibacillus montaniterrae TaxID=429341 RepID=A0A919YJM2_9BACL|nr:YifB family Mg chelatase-like AAA ATPase [Paenibacillus montaniterrae]GIP14532.1 magnesium chelatase [Paenibacillus montaniterrae]
MFATVHSAIVVGVEGTGITVEVDITSGIPQISVVGLPDSAVRESVERVRSAIRNSGFRFPLERITINLAPAALRKQGSGLDLAIATGLLQASAQLQHDFEHTLLVGELALDGHVRPINGMLALLQYAKQAGCSKVIIPQDNAAEAGLISDLHIYPIAHLNQLQQLNFQASAQFRSLSAPAPADKEELDLADIVGQQEAKRALLIAAAGRHNIIVCGPPGVGKTMLMRRLPTLLPQLAEAEALEVMKIYSVAGKLQAASSQLQKNPPFRAPHHSISYAGLIGGGGIPQPGEITLAHHGVLFLDELPEFSRQVLELLRQPLEERTVTISRARNHITFPASFMLAASYNPCPCGYYGFETEHNSCGCSQLMIQRYRSKLSGPLLDRIDIQLDMARPLTLAGEPNDMQYGTEKLKAKVLQAISVQQERYREQRYRYNSELPASALSRYAAIPKEAAQLLEHAFTKLGLSMRGYERIIKIARTIADLELSEHIQLEHVAEAVQYRKLDMAFAP